MVTNLKELLDFPGTYVAPEASSETIAAPIAVVLDSDSAWQDFQDTQTQFDEEFEKSKSGRS